MQYTGLSLISLYSLDDLDDVSESTIRSSSSFFEPDVEVSSRSAVSFSMPDKILLAIFALYMPLSLGFFRTAMRTSIERDRRGINYEGKWEEREQGWRSDESTRLPPMLPGFKSRRRRHMWIEFVVGSLLCSERFFSGYSGFPLSLKTNTFKFQFDLERTDTFKRVHMNFFCFASWVK